MISNQPNHVWVNWYTIHPTIEANNKIELSILAAEGFVELSQYHLGKNLETSKKHLMRAEPCLMDYQKNENQHDHFWEVFEDCLTVMALSGQRTDALALVQQIQDVEKIPALMVHIISATN